MRIFLLAFVISRALFSFGQVTVVQPQLYYFSKRQLKDLQQLHVGDKILFQQQCSPELPPDVATGTVFFENVYDDRERFSMAVEFKDTIVVSVTYYLRAKQTDVLKEIGYPLITANASADKNLWTSILQNGKMQTVIVGDKKKITIVETLE